MTVPRLRELPAGLVDAGASSLATFAAGIAAVRLLSQPSWAVTLRCSPPFWWQPSCPINRAFRVLAGGRGTTPSGVVGRRGDPQHRTGRLDSPPQRPAAQVLVGVDEGDHRFFRRTGFPLRRNAPPPPECRWSAAVASTRPTPHSGNPSCGPHPTPTRTRAHGQTPSAHHVPATPSDIPPTWTCTHPPQGTDPLRNPGRCTTSSLDRQDPLLWLLGDRILRRSMPSCMRLSCEFLLLNQFRDCARLHRDMTCDRRRFIRPYRHRRRVCS